MPKQNIGLFITRVQPGLHLGQMDALQQAIDQGITKFIVGIGSSNKEFTTENPFTHEERNQMVLLSAKGLKGIEIETFSLPDLADDEQWKKYILEHSPAFDYVVTGNVRVKEIFEQSKKIVWVKVRKEVKGQHIREHLALGDVKQLQNMLPKNVVDYLMEIHAPQRLQDIFRNERKTPNISVDMIFHDMQGNIILIERKYAPYGVALPGGFVKYGENPEDAVIREIQEETGAKVRIQGLLGVYGDPERDARAHNIAIVYIGKYIDGNIVAGDDAKKIIKIKPDLQSLKKYEFAFDHQNILTDYINSRIYEE